jgi:citrate synthase
VEYFLLLLGLGKARPGEEGPDPRVVRALDVILLAHADHELNCSTAALRHLTSSGVDVYTAVAGATGALYGPLHGGATEAVLRMLQQIGTEERIPAFLEAVKAKEAKLMGFGHRVYKNYDPRAVLVREVAYEVFQVYGADPLIHVATALETAARSDNYFVSRKLYPNIDFYSGLVYKAIGFPLDFFPVLFTMGRMAGWLAHWEELLIGPEEEKKIVRPRQIYLGPAERAFLPIEARGHDGIAAEPERLLPSTTRARL